MLDLASATRIACQVIGLTLLLATIAKIRRSEIVADVVAYQVVPPSVVPFVAYCLVVAEGIAGVCLVATVAVPVASGGASALFASFAGAIAWNLSRRATFACGCFGSGASEPISWFVFARALVLFVLSGFVVIHASELHAGEFVTTGEATIVAGFIVLLRLLGLVPLGLSFIRAPASIAPVPTRRMGFRHVPIESSLFAQMRAPGVELDSSLRIPLVDRDGRQG